MFREFTQAGFQRAQILAGVEEFAAFRHVIAEAYAAVWTAESAVILPRFAS
jgi:hypothetical protein